MNKKCKKCGRYRPIGFFVKSKECRNGRTGTCRKCKNKYHVTWNRKNATRRNAERRKQYAETEGLEVKERERQRAKRHPLRVQCQRLYAGMRRRAQFAGQPFDQKILTINYLMGRIELNPFCDCCGRKLRVGVFKGKTCDSSITMDRVNCRRGYTVKNVAILCWRCNRLKNDATAKELRMIADWMQKRLRGRRC